MMTIPSFLEMDKLPNEVVQKICKYFSRKKDVQTVRRINRQWNTAMDYVSYVHDCADSRVHFTEISAIYQEELVKRYGKNLKIARVQPTIF